MNESSGNNDKREEVKNAQATNALSLSETSPSCCAENAISYMTNLKINSNANKTVDKTISKNTEEEKITSPVVNIAEPTHNATKAAKDATEKVEVENIIKTSKADPVAGVDNNDAKAHSHSTSSGSASNTHSFAGQALSDALNELSQSDKRNSSSIFTDTSITWVKVLNVTSFSTVSLNITWGVCVIGALSCFLLSEVYQVLSPIYPLTFVVSVGCYLSVLSAIVVYFLGRKKFGTQYYRLYQPFMGGQRFVILQFLGVLTLMFAMIGASAHLKVFDASHVTHGVLASLGAAGVIGSTLLWLSLRYFDVPLRILTPSAHSRLSRKDDYTDSTRHARRQLHLQPCHDKYHTEQDHHLYKHHHSSSEYYSSEKVLSLLCRPPNRELAIVVCVMVGQFILSNAATLVKHGVPGYVAVINTIAQIVNWVIVHCHIGCKHIDGYSMFMLSLHRPLDTCLYWFLQSVYLVSVLTNVALVYEGDETTPFAMIVVAALNLFSCGVYILFIRTTSFKASRTPSYSSMSEYGSIAVVVSAIGAGLFNLCVEYLLQYWPSTELEFVIGTSSWSTHELLSLCLISSQVFLLALSPFTDRLGRVIHGDAFSLFSPHFGSLAANIIQAFGWLLYVLAMLSFTLYISARDVRLCSLSTIGAILSVMCIVFAIRAYDKTNHLFSSASFVQNSSNLKDGVTKDNGVANPLPFSPSSPSPSPSPLTSPSVPTRLLSPQHISDGGNVNDLETDQFGSFCGPVHITFVLNNEMMLSYLIALASVMLNFVVDISLQHIWGVVEVPVERIMTMSDLLFILAVPLAHYSARDKGVHVWMPFAGSGRFVALQVLGWTMYALHVIFTIVTNIFVHSNTVSLRHILHFFAHYRIYCSMFGLLRLTPIILITLSIAVETQRAVKCAELRLIAQDAFEYMRNVATEAIATSSMSTSPATAHTNTEQKEQDDENNNAKNDNIVAVMQLAFRTVAEPMLQYYEIPYTDESFALHASSSTHSEERQEDWLRNSAGNMIVQNENKKKEKNSVNKNNKVHTTHEVDNQNLHVHNHGDNVNANVNANVNDMKTCSNLQDSIYKKSFVNSNYNNKSMLVTPEQQNRHESMRIIIILLCCASATFYLLAAFLYKLPMFSFAFVICASLVCTASCIGVHAGYGNIVHGSSGEYGVFMPFKGGRKYLQWQVIGWWCYALTFLVTLEAAIESERLAPPILIIAALLSVVSQVCIFNSIPWFVIHHDKLSFLEENGEGIVALCGVAGAFAVSYVYNLIDQFVDRNDGFSLRSLVGKRVRSQPHVPFVVSMLSISLTVPCILIALGRTTRQWRHVAKRAAQAESATAVPAADDDDKAAKKGKTHNVRWRSETQEHASTRLTVNNEAHSKVGQADSPKSNVEITSHLNTVWATAIMNMLEVLVITMSTILPLSLAFFAYNFTQNYTPHLFHLIEYFLPILCGMIVLTLLLSIVPYVVSVGVPEFAIRLRIAVITHCMFSMALITASAVLIPMFIWPRVSTIYETCCIVFITVIGSYEQVRVGLWFGAYLCIGYCSYQFYAAWAYPQIHFPATRSIIRFVYDVFTLSLWIWYIPRYRGKPYYTGAKRNKTFIDFARKYIYADMAKYFTFSVVVDDPEALNLRDGKHQYLFSIHPHGVFASTALYGIHTEEWERLLGSAPNQYISLHEATIVFNIPVVRDFNLAMGALLVSRPCIEGSIRRGNSVLIVTGGQAEMLFTKTSDTELTLITRHTGFIRIAIANRIPLVPLIALGENNVLGLLEMPTIQQIGLRFLGFPFPVIPYGRWFLPLPFPAHVSLLVGKPIPIPEGASEDNPDDVQALSKEYFNELKRVFYRRRADGGYPNMELYLTDGKSHRIKSN